MQRSSEQASAGDTLVVETVAVKRPKYTDEWEWKYLVKGVTAMRTYGLALDARYQPDDETFVPVYCNALVQALDVDPYIVAQVSNLDQLRYPFPKEGDSVVNCAQALALKGGVSVDAVLRFLCDWKDRNDTPYEHTEPMREILRATLKNILRKYGNAANYFGLVSVALWQPHDYLMARVPTFATQLQARLDALRDHTPLCL